MIDPNEAPDGFVAVAGKFACQGCFFDREGGCGSPRSKCLRSERDDNQSVIFVPREKSNLAESGELQKAKDEASRWKAACLDRDNLIAKLKAQLTTALESIARMR